jgi:hypothetical protein
MGNMTDDLVSVFSEVPSEIRWYGNFVAVYVAGPRWRSSIFYIIDPFFKHSSGLTRYVIVDECCSFRTFFICDFCVVNLSGDAADTELI